MSNFQNNNRLTSPTTYSRIKNNAIVCDISTRAIITRCPCPRNPAEKKMPYTVRRQIRERVGRHARRRTTSAFVSMAAGGRRRRVGSGCCVTDVHFLQLFSRYERGQLAAVVKTERIPRTGHRPVQRIDTRARTRTTFIRVSHSTARASYTVVGAGSLAAAANRYRTGPDDDNHSPGRQKESMYIGQDPCADFSLSLLLFVFYFFIFFSIPFDNMRCFFSAVARRVRVTRASVRPLWTAARRPVSDQKQFVCCTRVCERAADHTRRRQQ